MVWGRRVLALGVLCVGLLSASPAEASVRLGLGADYWFHGQGMFNVTLGVTTPLARNLQLGGRFGAFITTGGNQVGVPLDLLLRATFGRVYVEGLVGPWIFFGAGDPLRAHAAFGFGLLSGSLSFGLEVGWTQPSTMAGLRLSWRI